MADQFKEDGHGPRTMQAGFLEYLRRRRAEPSPREAHLFALAMRHGGVTFDLPVREIVLMLAGELPDYWPK